MKQNHKLTLTAILIPLLLMVGTFSIWAQFAGGQGTEDDPWQVAEAEHLNNVREHLNAHFIQISHIDLGVPEWSEGEGWEPIGSSDANSFQGSYNGNGYIITGMTINRPEAGYQGLFGWTIAATISGIGLEDVEISDAGSHAGALIGATVFTNISNCYATGSITAVASFTGGLIGMTMEMTQVTDCWTDIDLRTASNHAGGLIGVMEHGRTENSFSLGDLSVTEEEDTRVAGGLVGANNRGTITNCYSRGNISAPEEVTLLGGLVGINNEGTVSNCYSTGRIDAGEDRVGGLIGRNSGDVSSSYWDRETSGMEQSDGGEGRQTREMTYPYADDIFTDWDFDEIWLADEDDIFNDGYPILYYQYEELLDIPEVSITIQEDTVHLTWDMIEGANSYKIYSVEVPDAEDWGEPRAVVGETQFSEPVENENRMLYYYVVASTEEAP